MKGIGLQSRHLYLVWGYTSAVCYGLGMQWAYQLSSEDVWRTLSIAFLFLVPLAAGSLTVMFSARGETPGWGFAVFAPWAPSLGIAVVAGLLQHELWVCIVMALPFFCLLASIGGAGMTFYLRRRKPSDKASVGALVIILLLPIGVGPMEAQKSMPRQELTVWSRIVVAADAETVWSQFIEVPHISEAEERGSLFRMLGLPRPVEARLDRVGEAGTRTASYSNGVRVLEPITVWQPYERYQFSVEVDRSAPLPSPAWVQLKASNLMW